MKRKRLYEPKHPFNAAPFEAFSSGSWQPVEIIDVKDGAMNFRFVDNQFVIEEKETAPIANLRIRSRPAAVNDCTCFLRPGVDVCVLSPARKTQTQTSSSETNGSEPVWVDARISTIERKPHEPRCYCRFFVQFYSNQGRLGSERGTLIKETEEFGINKICVLQKLEQNTVDDDLFYRWGSSTDCSLLQRTKLLLGKFLSDLTWLLAVSVLRKISFQVRAVENKLIYQIIGGEDECCLKNSDNHIHTLNFKLENTVSTPLTVRYDPPVALKTDHGGGPITYFDVDKLRRSKRRIIQPDRYLASDIVSSELQIGFVRELPYRVDNKVKEEDVDEDWSLSFLYGKNEASLEEEPSLNADSKCHNDLIVYKRRKKPVKEVENENLLAIVPFPGETNKHHDHLETTKITKSDSKQHCNTATTSAARVRAEDRHEDLDGKCDNRGYSFFQSKKEEYSELEDMVFESKWKGKHNFFSSTTSVRASSSHAQSRRDHDHTETLVYRKRTLSDGAYNRLINSYMKNVDSSTRKDHPMAEWEDLKSKNGSQQKKERDTLEEEEEVSETELLWREMETALASAYVLDNDEVSSDKSEIVTEEAKGCCQHDFILNEEVGILCRICGDVETEIKYVTEATLETDCYTWKKIIEEDSDHSHVDNADLDLAREDASPDIISPEKNENVWALIPTLEKKLHLHQKKAFEFLWRNISGSLIPEQIERTSKKTGGCVISHSPGAGKTFLIIAFLVSHLKLFPNSRPLILAPKTTLYTWYKEFIKWEIPIPVHLIHGRRTYRVFKKKKKVAIHGALKPTLDVMHVLDCLEKIQKWHEEPGLLVMGYTSFLTLMRENSKFAHRRYMAKVLRESPGLLVLDEGHNPRSTKSRLRKALMKVETDLRVLLSGTLFQNNFCEYFNTLTLARPKFVNEVLKELDPKFKRRKKGSSKKPSHLRESRARKFFIDGIGKKIDSSEGDDRVQGLNMLRNLTSGFIDNYEGSGSAEALPGLQLYTLMMNLTEIQQDVVTKLQKIMGTVKGYPLELELLITLASIHPWLVKSSNCCIKFFSADELLALEKLKTDFRRGSKVMFVLNLVYRVIGKEKVLIFCHNIAPINLFIQLFESIFKWEKGKEVLVLTGDLELFERGRVMDRFEEAGGPSRVLLASITACCEGISLTAASRVIMLDSEWNPSKTKQAIARAFRPGQQKLVYVYQLLATGSLEEDKYRRTTWKEWVSSMIFSEAFVEDPSKWQAEKIEDDVLREMVAEDRTKSFHMIMKNEKASTG